MRELSKHWVLLCLLIALSPRAGHAFEAKQKLAKIVEYSLPYTYAKYSPEWRLLRNSCAEAGAIVRDHQDLEIRIALLEARSPVKKGSVRALILEPKDALTQSQFKSLPALRALQLHRLDELFGVVEWIFKLWIDDSFWGVRTWAESLLADARQTRTTLKTALERQDFGTCVRVLDEYLPPDTGRSS